MRWRPIQNASETRAIPSNLVDDDTTCAPFSWEAVRHELDGLPSGTSFNMAYSVIIWRCDSWDGPVREFT